MMAIMSGCQKSEPMKIVCIGDSLGTCGQPDGRYSDYLQARLPDCEIVNKCISGDTLDGGRARFQADVIALEPDIVIIQLGANDYWKAKRSKQELAADLESMVVDSKNIGAEVVIASCFGKRRYLANNSKTEIDRRRDRYAEYIADIQADIVKKYNCFYAPDIQVDILPNGRAPYWTDNNHPNKQGNKFVAQRIYDELAKAVEAAKK